MCELREYRVVVKYARKKVTPEIVRKQLIKELGHLGDVRLESYEVEKLSLFQFEVENNPDDSYYVEVSSVKIKYFIR